MYSHIINYAIAVVSVVVVPLTTQAQAIPKGAEAIEIKTDLTDSLAYERLITLLLADGYVTKIADEKHRVIVTDNRPIKVSTWAARILANVNSGTIRLRTEGSISLMGLHVENTPLVYKGGNSGADKIGFNKLDAFSRQLTASIPNATVTYTVPETKH